MAALGDGESCSKSRFKNCSVLAERTPGVVNKISAEKSFSLSSLGGCSKVVRLTFCIELSLLAGCYCWVQALIWSSWLWEGIFREALRAQLDCCKHTPSNMPLVFGNMKEGRKLSWQLKFSWSGHFSVKLIRDFPLTSKRKSQQINSILCKEEGKVTLAKNEKLSDTCPIWNMSQVNVTQKWLK